MIFIADFILSVGGFFSTFVRVVKNRYINKNNIIRIMGNKLQELISILGADDLDVSGLRIEKMRRDNYRKR